jgi:hypothetical protein
LNTTFIKKQKYSDADLNYGGFSMEFTDQMLEIGEVQKLSQICFNPFLNIYAFMAWVKIVDSDQRHIHAVLSGSALFAF